jgi:hypothetical protein
MLRIRFLFGSPAAELYALDRARLPSYSTIRNDAEASDMSRVQHFDGRGRDPRPRKPSDANVASRSRGRKAVDRNQNAWERTPARRQLSLSQVRIPRDVRAAGLTNAEAAKGASEYARFASVLI